MLKEGHKIHHQNSGEGFWTLDLSFDADIPNWIEDIKLVGADQDEEEKDRTLSRLSSLWEKKKEGMFVLRKAKEKE